MLGTAATLDLIREIMDLISGTRLRVSLQQAGFSLRKCGNAYAAVELVRVTSSPAPKGPTVAERGWVHLAAHIGG